MTNSVSVVIPTCNRPDYLVRAVQSVLAQTLSPLEIIVVDDCSDVNSSEGWAEEFGPKVRVIRHPERRGAPAARNTGLYAARGAFVAFLDDDDLWLSQKLALQMKVFKTGDPALALVFCGESLVKEGQTLQVLQAKWDESSPSRMLELNIVGGTSTAMIRRDYGLAIGGFDESLPSCQDWDLWLRIAQRYQVACVPEILVHRTIHGEQISSAIGKRIAGREAFLAKHYQGIAQSSSALSQHYRRIGCLRAAAGMRGTATEALCKAIRARPYSCNSWVCLMINSLFPSKVAIKLLTHYAISRFGNVEIYH